MMGGAVAVGKGRFRHEAFRLVRYRGVLDDLSDDYQALVAP